MAQYQIDKLIEDFVVAAKMHHKATMQGRWPEANEQAKHIKRLFSEIAEIGDDARQALLIQVDNDDLAVASMAAVYSLKYDTARSVQTLQRISQEPGIIGFGAKQALMRWEEGEWRLE